MESPGGRAKANLLPVALLTVIGIAAVGWLTFVVMQGIITRSAREAELASLTSHLAVVQQQVVVAEEKQTELTATLDKLNNDIRSKQQDLDGLEARLISARAIVKKGEEFEAALPDLQKQHQGLVDDSAKLARRNAADTQTSIDLQNQIAASKDMLLQLNTQIATVTDNRATASSALNDLQGEIEAAKVTNAGLKQTYDELNEKIVAGQASLSKLNGDTTRASSAAETASKRLTTIQQTIDDSTKQRDQLATEVASLQGKKQNLDADLASAKAASDASDAANKKLAEITAQIATAEDKLDHAKADYDRYQAQAATATKTVDEIMKLNAQLAGLTKQRDDLSKSITELSEQQAQLTTAVAGLVQKQGVLNQLSQTESELNTHLARLKLQETDLQNRVSTLTKQLNDLTKPAEPAPPMAAPQSTTPQPATPNGRPTAPSDQNAPSPSPATPDKSGSDTPANP